MLSAIRTSAAVKNLASKNLVRAVPLRRGLSYESSTKPFYSNYGFYKPHRFDVSVMPAEFRHTVKHTAFALKRNGVILVSMSPYVEERKTISWAHKTQFGLSPEEALEFADVLDHPAGEVLIHRPMVDPDTQVKTEKILRVECDPDSSGGVIVSTSGDDAVSMLIHLNKYEFGVIKRIIDFAIPHVCGIYKSATQMKLIGDQQQQQYAQNRFGGDSSGPPEWAL